MCGLSVAGGALGGVVGRAGEQDGRVPGAFGDDDDGVQLDAVAHGDHHFALDVVITLLRHVESFWNVAAAGLRRLAILSQGQSAQSEDSGKFHVTILTAFGTPYSEL